MSRRPLCENGHCIPVTAERRRPSHLFGRCRAAVVARSVRPLVLLSSLAQRGRAPQARAWPTWSTERSSRHERMTRRSPEQIELVVAVVGAAAPPTASRSRRSELPKRLPDRQHRHQRERPWQHEVRSAEYGCDLVRGSTVIATLKEPHQRNTWRLFSAANCCMRSHYAPIAGFASPVTPVRSCLAHRRRCERLSKRGATTSPPSYHRAAVRRRRGSATGRSCWKEAQGDGERRGRGATRRCVASRAAAAGRPLGR